MSALYAVAGFTPRRKGQRFPDRYVPSFSREEDGVVVVRNRAGRKVGTLEHLGYEDGTAYGPGMRVEVLVLHTQGLRVPAYRVVGSDGLEHDVCQNFNWLVAR